MRVQATLADFEDVVQRIGSTVKDDLARQVAAITAEASAKGALSNSRLVFLYTDALEGAWAALADNVLSELRRWTSETKIGRHPLRDAAERDLRNLIPTLIETSRVKWASARLSNQAMLKPAWDRIDALTTDLTHRLRQFDIGMDAPEVTKGTSGWRRGLKNYATQITVGIIIAVAGAAIAGWLSLPT